MWRRGRICLVGGDGAVPFPRTDPLSAQEYRVRVVTVGCRRSGRVSGRLERGVRIGVAREVVAMVAISGGTSGVETKRFRDLIVCDRQSGNIGKTERMIWKTAA